MLRNTTARIAVGDHHDRSARPRPSILLLALLSSLVGVALAATSAEPPVQPVHFSVIGDTPYSESEIDEVAEHFDDHNLYSNSEFLVHVGDIKAQGDACSEHHYTTMADVLRMLAVPAFIVPGDNEWTDCVDPDQGWAYWEEHLLGIEQDFCGTPAVASQSARPENFAFFEEDVLFIGITMLSGLPSSVREASADWIDTQFSENASSARAIVIFAQKEPGGPVFDAIVEGGADFGGPILYLHGNGHEWEEDPVFFGAPNMLRVQVDRGNASAPPVHVTVSEAGSFVFDRDPWPSGTQPYNRAPCVDAGPDISLGLSEPAQLQGLVTDDGVPGAPDSLVVTWQRLSGPGSVSFANPSAPATTATFGAAGTYTLELSADDGELTSSSTLRVVVGGGSGSSGGEVTVHEVVTGGSTALASVATASPVSGVDGHLYLAAIATKKNSSVTGVSGLSLTWSPVRTQCSGRGQTGVSVWQAWGNGGGSGGVTASLDSAPTSAVIAVSHFSGASGLGGVGSANTVGISGACDGGVDTGAYSFDLGASGSSSVAYVASAMRNKDHEPGSAYTERAEVHHGASGGETAGLAISDRVVGAPGPIGVNGTFNKTVDWAVVALEILAAEPTSEEFSVSVSPATGGSVTLDPPGGSYAAGTSVTVTAVPASGFGFVGWSGDLTGAANPDILVVDSDKTIGASFSSQQYAVSVAPSSGGSVTLNPPGGSYAAGTLVGVTAVPDPGNVFTGWNGDLSGADNPETLLVDVDKSVSAGFAPAVTLTLTPATGGSLVLDPPGGVYPAGTIVTVTATPDTGYVFSGWNGDLTGTGNPEIVVADVDKTIGASFAVQRFDVEIVPSSNGSVTLNPPGGTYDSGSVVGVSATPAPGYVFTGWGGDLSGTGNPESLLVDTDKSVSASFALSVTLTAAGSGGRVTLDPPGGVYAAGTSVTVTAVADPDFGFVGWGGDLSGTANPQTLVVDTDKSVSASFDPTFTVAVPALSGGSVTLDPPGGVYTVGTIVNVTAVASSGFIFASWGGDLSGTANPTSLVVDGDKTVTADFDAVYTLSARGTGGGSVVLDPPGGSYIAGTVVTLTAVPGNGRRFRGWTGDLSGTANPETITMDGNKSVRARFGKQR